ncbi:MAG: alanine--tRNA ligase [Clostridiaceae bacterium]|jgi:alanyl-tRNA synthetase|nr:alanine--tRNA ligase [Clostridiaceae bacterium]
MQKYGLNELREMFLSFFESKGHLRLPSFSLVPKNDPSILLINAGMTPLKPYFTGREVPPSKRIATCQKCIRTPDIENVGKTSRHGTFFEMLGNFSFGDYFKKEAITWAWEFFTKVLEIPEDRLYVSVYEKDDEAYDIWNKDVGLPHNKIFRMGKEDNFWEHGIGPCGPCSEIYYDRGVDKGCGKPDCTVGCDCDRYIEVWNNVFTQFDKQEDGTYVELASKNIDTGMGLERLACIIQDVDNIFEVDAIRSILDHVCRIAGVEYGTEYKKDVSIRVITDHVRSVAMMVSDGILPSNEGRGYVLRRLLRRAARHGRLLGINRVFLAEIVDTVIDCFGKAYPNLIEKQDYIKKVVSLEEERFYATVDQGMVILEDYMKQVKNDGSDKLTGEMVFKLHDTYGFPMDLTREIASENNLIIDEEGFHNEMRAQKNKAREAHKSKEGSAWEKDLFANTDKTSKTEFVGYAKYTEDGTVQFIVLNDELADSAQQDDEVTIVLDKTPFYAESGGQAGDSGTIYNSNFKMSVRDCRKTADGKHLHLGKIIEGGVHVGDKVTASIDIDRRKAAARNHTTTHLLHKALRNVLGDHVNQAGSFVNHERLRFDFTHFSAMTREQIEAVENEVNGKILENLCVKTEEMSVDDAMKSGAIALFDEKYGDLVRVVSTGDYSKELCGGTHLSSTGEAGLIKILSENGISAGVRRIEALTGFNAINYYKEKESLLKHASEAAKSSVEDIVNKIENLYDEIKTTKKELEDINSKMVNSSLNSFIEKAIVVKGMKIVTAKLDGLDMNALRNASDTLKNKVGSGVVILASSKDDKVNLIVSATKDAVDAGIHSGNIIKEAARACGGGGGGRPDMAQAGGKDPSGMDKALEIARERAASMLN